MKYKPHHPIESKGLGRRARKTEKNLAFEYNKELHSTRNKAKKAVAVEMKILPSSDRT